VQPERDGSETTVMTGPIARIVERILPTTSTSEPRFYVGDWVEVRSKEEILRTLDKKGQLDGMPFMPEMFSFCGKRFRVYKRAHKTCDTAYEYKGRKMRDAVHLEGLRCDGQSHGGCEASCLIFWKTAWLRPVDRTDVDAELRAGAPGRERAGAMCTEADVMAGTRRSEGQDGETAYVCQATQVPTATEQLGAWECRQYVEDYTSGNVGLARMAKTFAYMAYRHRLVNLGIGIGPTLVWLYNGFQRLRRGTPFPHRRGKLPSGARTPGGSLDLQPGEWVRVKSLDAIRATCDQSNMNRGMTFDAEMVPYCGGTYRVAKRVTRILNEQTGRMQAMKNPCIILDTVVCQARYSDCRPFCPRSVYPFWREIWLQRVEPPTTGPGAARMSGDVEER
jgi:hypothetical protein